MLVTMTSIKDKTILHIDYGCIFTAMIYNKKDKKWYAKINKSKTLKNNTRIKKKLNKRLLTS